MVSLDGDRLASVAKVNLTRTLGQSSPSPPSLPPGSRRHKGNIQASVAAAAADADAAAAAAQSACLFINLFA